MAGMKGRDRAIVAGILAVALIVGLALVGRALDQAAQAQTASLASAQFNGGGSSSQPEEREDREETDVPPSGETDSQGDSPAEGEETDQTPEEEPPQAVQTAGDGAVPSAGGGAMSLEQLSQWMQNESSGALAAQSLWQADLALASGVGSEDDPLRRSFAQEQAADNDAARRNQLAEEAISLGLECLKWQELLLVREESATFYKELEEAVSAKIQPEEGQNPEEEPAETAPEGEGDPADLRETSGEGWEERVNADLQTVREAKKAAETAVAEAESQLRQAVQALNIALGNPPETELTITDSLLPEEMPSLSEEEAVAQALELRNEIKAAAYQLEREEQTLEQLRYQYAPNAPEILEQQAVLQQAQAACPQAAGQVEADVRGRLESLNRQAQELEALSAELEGEEAARPEPVYELTDGGEAGGWTSDLGERMERWAELESRRVSLVEQTAQFNLDVRCFPHAVGVGCTAVVI